MATRRLNISLKPQVALEITRVSIRQDKLVYVLLVDKPLKYRWGRSKIAYIGTTKTGLRRIASSASKLAFDVLSHRGVKTCSVRIVTCTGRRNVKTWAKLERALILVLREVFGDIPAFNVQGKRMREQDEFKYFKRPRLKQVLSTLSK